MKKARKILAFTIVAALLMQFSGTAFAAEAIDETPTIVASGKCGAEVVWELDSEGTLTVSGTGPTYDYDYFSYPACYSYPAWQENVKKAVIEDGVTAIGDFFFYGCKNLMEVSIPDSIIKIGNETFSWCTKIEEIVLPENLSDLGYGAFHVCSKLKSINIPEGITRIPNYTFDTCEALKQIEIPKNIKEIGNSAFYRTGLKSVHVPDTVESIKESAFGSCESLEQISISRNITEIDNFVFDGCSSLKKVELPSKIKKIGRFAFAYCYDLETVIMQEGVEEIGSCAFYNNKSIKSMVLPESIKTIGDHAFNQCTLLESINIPGGITEIPECLFNGCHNLKEISLPDNVEIIGDHALDNLEKVIIGDNVKKIGYYAFDQRTIVNGFKNSEADHYASKYGNKFIPFEASFIWDGTEKCTVSFTDMNGNTVKTMDCEIKTVTAEETVTCTEDGKSGYLANATVAEVKYTDFMAYGEDSVEAPGHDYNAQFDWKTDDDCEITLTCSRCSDTVTDKCTVTENVTKSATCKEEGYRDLSASYVYEGKTYEESRVNVTIPMEKHKYDEQFQWKGDAECSILLTCKSCDDSAYEACEVTENITKKATCKETGTKTITASYTIDGETFTDTKEGIIIPIAGHTWDEDFTVDKMPTETEQGQVSIHCSLCGCIDPDSITAVPAYITRIAGSNRYATSIKAAEYLAELAGVEKFENIVVACGTNFADALSGSYLANVKEAPVIVVDTASPASYEEVMKYIRGKIASHGTVYILGGTGAVSQEFQDELEARGIDTQRLGGKDRYATNIEILKEAGVDSLYYGDMMIACGSNFADALSASAVGLPIMLTGEGLNENQQQYLQRVDIDTAYILGGTGAVSEATREQVGEYTEYTCRLAGSNRFETSLAIAEAFFPYERDAVVLAVGDNFPDGLSAGPLAMVQDAPLILVMDNVTEHAEKYAYNHECMWAVVMGGEPLISNDSVRRIIQ